MAWIESHQSLRDHPKTKRLARLLGISKVTAIGHLHCLWWWTLDYAQDGDISRFDAADIADAVDWDGDPDALFQALTQAGFIDDGKVHDWECYAGRLVTKREQNAARQRDWRERSKHVDPTHTPVTVTSPLRNEHVQGLPTEPTEPTEPTTPPKSPKGDQYSAEFENDFWAHYPKGRGSKQAAFKLWEKLTEAERTDARDALPKFKAGSDWTRGFHSAPEVWLRGRMWENPPAQTTTTNPNGMPPEIARLQWNNAERIKWEYNHRVQAS